MTPLIIVVGFLGAGKTTYLKNFLPELVKVGIEPHVIINDYENANVDAEFFAGLAKHVTPINGSCVCCGSRDQLIGSLKNFEHGLGRVMIIETNGTTDSEELIEMLTVAPELERFSPPTQISIIDGKRWQKRFWHNSLEFEQAKTANYLYLSRMDEIDDVRLGKIIESLRKHALPQEFTDSCQFALIVKNLSEKLAEIERRSDLGETNPSRSEYRIVSAQPHRLGHHNHSAHHFASFQINLPERLVRASLVKFLGELPESVIRAKGVVQFTDSGDQYFIFQKVDRFEKPQFFPIRKPSGDCSTLAIFIGPAIPEKEVRAAAESLLSS